MSCVQEHNICRKRGDTHPEVFQLKQNGVAVDITGDTFRLTVATRPDPPDNSFQVFQLTGSILVAASGTFQFTPNTTQADQNPGTYYYDVQWIENTSGQIRTILAGTWTFEQDITKETT